MSRPGETAYHKAEPGDQFTRYVKCDRCGARLTTTFTAVLGDDGKVHIEQDLYSLEYHFTEHSNRTLEERYGPDQNRWPSWVDSMRAMLDRATAKSERGKVEARPAARQAGAVKEPAQGGPWEPKFNPDAEDPIETQPDPAIPQPDSLDF